jgi:peptide/nickel transport system substrate-binding protein
MFDEDSGYWARSGRRRVSRRVVLRGAAAGAAGIAAAALVGCGADEEEGAGPASPATPAGTSPAVTGGQPSAAKSGGTLNYLIGGDPPNLDHHANSTYLVNHAINEGYNQLLQMDPAVADEAPTAVIPDLAESWEIADDGMTYTFSLVKNAKYHDGTAFTSEDVEASMDRVKNPPSGVPSPRQGQIEPIETIETPDAHTVVFKLNRPMSSLSLLPILAQGWMSIYSAKDIAADFDFSKGINGTGPFRFKEYQRGNRVVWEKNADYHVEGRPYLDGITVFVIPDSSTRLANFQSGALHVSDLLSVKDSETMQRELGDKVTLHNIPGYGFSTINFGQRDPWFDERVRQAISMAHNRDDFVKIVQQGEGRMGGYLSPGGFWALTEEETLELPGYERYSEATVSEARKLLDAAGVADGFETTILTRNISENLSLFIQDQLAKVGIKATPQVLESAAAYDALNQRNFDLAPWGHAYAVDDPDAVFAEFYITDAPRNYSEISTPGIDDLFLKQSMEQDQEQRQEMVRELQRIALPKGGKVILGWSNRRGGAWNQVKDWLLHSSNYNNQRWENVWLDA